MLGARDLHPVSAAVGGWLALPSQEELGKLKQELIAAKVTADNTCEIFFDLGYPDFKTEGNYFSLAHTKVFPVLEGSFCMTNRCRDRHEYKEFIEEHHEKHSSANFVVKEGKRYFTGALARINNNKDNLSDDAKKMLSQSAITFPSKNPYHNNIAQAIEMVHCIDEAIRICDRKIKNEKFKRPEPKAGTGIAAIEVPRGTLWHEYELDGAGKILNANIITPTSQNLLNMQEDIRQIVPMLLDKKKEDVVLEIEKLIRSYDPCFSCSAHFLEVKWV
ncbi:MAG: nickel-dependent hydrogenase large subunit [Candidatus Nanoarchaeia archaeon]